MAKAEVDSATVLTKALVVSSTFLVVGGAAFDVAGGSTGTVVTTGGKTLVVMTWITGEVVSGGGGAVVTTGTGAFVVGTCAATDLASKVDPAHSRDTSILVDLDAAKLGPSR